MSNRKKSFLREWGPAIAAAILGLLFATWAKADVEINLAHAQKLEAGQPGNVAAFCGAATFLATENYEAIGQEMSTMYASRAAYFMAQAIEKAGPESGPALYIAYKAELIKKKDIGPDSFECLRLFNSENS